MSNEDQSTPSDQTNAADAIRQERLGKIEAFRATGIDPYPSGPVHKTDALAALELEDGVEVTVAGRIMLLRDMGNIAFAHLRDESGDIQIMLSRKEIDANAKPDQDYKFLLRNLDIGDFIQVDGTRMTTRKGERSVSTKTVTVLSKCLRPLPDKHAGLTDEDTRFRRRYLDILLNEDVKEMIYRKANFWRSTREFMHDLGFVEVATPVLEHTTGGADAKPFVTHHNFLDADVSLRISTGELWQKRLLVAGLEKVYEIGRQFRNENQSREHANDYEQLEFYWAYANADLGMEMVENLYKYVMQQVFGTQQFSLNRNGRTYEVDLGAPWKRYDFSKTIEELTGCDIANDNTDVLLARLKEMTQLHEDAPNRERITDGLWKLCRKQLGGPGFVVNEPIELSPLAKRSASNPNVAERFHVLIAGSELGNGYSELNDPVDQAQRFATQQAMRDAGDDEAQEADWEYVEALEYGMPPAFGFGLSERVFSFFMDKSLRETQIFPLLRRTSPQVAPRANPHVTKP